MKYIIAFITLLLLGIFGIYFYFNHSNIISPLGLGKPQKPPIARPLQKYSFKNLINTQFAPTQITVGDVVKQYPTFTSQMFY